MMKKLFSLIGIVLFLGGCHWLDDPAVLQDCPLGSAYPCPCSTNCEGDQVCVHTQGGSSTYGQCTLPCDGDHEICTQASNGFGGGICLTNGYCATACAEDDDCPTGMGCDDNICIPGWLFDPYRGESDTATEPSDSDTTVQISDAQREAECTALCEKVFECFPDGQTYTLDEFIYSCIAGDWHNDSCGSCRLACDANALCDDFGTCIDTCDACK